MTSKTVKVLAVGIAVVLGTVALAGTAGAATTTVRVSSTATGAPGNAGSLVSQITPDGRYVTFQSGADNLVPNDNKFATDVFLKDRLTGKVELISVGPDGGPANY